MPVPLLPLALLAGALWAAPAPASEPYTGEPDPKAAAHRRFEDAVRHVEDSMADIQIGLEEFHALQDRCLAAPDRQAMDACREPARSTLFKKIDDLYHYGDTYAKAKYLWNTARVSETLETVLAAKPAPDVPSGLKEIRDVAALDQRYQAFLRTSGDALNQEDGRYNQAVLRLARRDPKRRAARAAAIVVPALALLGGGLLAWRRRRKSRAELPDLPASSAPALPLSGPGAVLAGDYRLERELGRGGMGVVYEATDLALGRKVAVKSALEGLAQDPRELEAVLKEAQSVAALKHPNIVSIYTVLREAERLYLVFELVEGKTLAQYVAARQGLPLKFVKSVVRQICSALEHAHERGIVHRDLKPSNIMVLADGRVKVMDFGIARLTRAAAARLTATRPMGTLLYMAPEQELGSVSKASDVFALGVCAYEMLTGARPFPGPDFLGQKKRMAFAPASSLVQGLPQAADALLRKALHAEPGGRFRSAGEFGEEFEKL